MSEPAKAMTRAERVDCLHRHLKAGDLVTFQVCGGSLREAVFRGWDGQWIVGGLTAETARRSKVSGVVDDIGPGNVTHVNREPIEILDFLANLKS